MAHLFTLATMVVCFAADFKHNNRKDKYSFRVIQRNYKKWEVSIYQILIRQKRNDLYAIAVVNNNLVNRTVSFENKLVPLNQSINKFLGWPK